MPYLSWLLNWLISLTAVVFAHHTFPHDHLPHFWLAIAIMVTRWLAQLSIRSSVGWRTCVARAALIPFRSIPFHRSTELRHPPPPRMVARVVTTLQLFAAETCNKFLKIEHHDSIVYSKHELILTFLAGATSYCWQHNSRTAGPTSQIFAADTSFAILYHVTESFAFTFPFTNLF